MALSALPDTNREAVSPALPLPPEGLYVHVPFCLSRCPYCDFVVFAGAEARGPRARVEALFEALLVELGLRTVSDGPGAVPGGVRSSVAGPSWAAVAGVPLGSVYLGGGTPSLLSAAQVGRFLETVDRRLGLASGAEITLEADPGPDERGDLAGFRAAGVTRLSIGAQSLSDVELRRLGRRHAAADVVATVAEARRAGFASLSLDLLTDLPRQSLADWRATLGAALDLGPDHLSIYTLTLADADAESPVGARDDTADHLAPTRGARAWRARARAEQSEARAADMELLTDEMVAAAGLRRYEIANLARPGHESRHNLLYWRRRPHLALGPGAHGFDGRARRWWNGASLDAYLAALSAGHLPPGGHEDVDAAIAEAEAAILGLRLSEGIPAALAARPAMAPALAWARSNGLAEDVAGRTRLTQAGRLLADEVFVRLLPEAEPSPGAKPSPEAEPSPEAGHGVLLNGPARLTGARATTAWVVDTAAAADATRSTAADATRSATA